MGTFHKSVLDGDLHRFGRIASSDPGSVGAHIAWIDTTADQRVVKVRTAGNDAWVQVSAPPTVATRTTDTYTLVAADGNAHLRVVDASGAAVEIPTNAAVPFPIGTTVWVEQAGAGVVTIVPDSGVTLRAAGGLVASSAQYAVIVCRKVAADEWVVYGDRA